MLLQDVLAAWRQVFSPPLRKILLRSIGLTIILLFLVWFGLTRLIGWFLKNHPISTDYPMIDSLAIFIAGAGIVVGLAYLLPAVSALVAGFFLDDAAQIVESTDFPAEPAGRPLSLAASAWQGLRFGALALGLNLCALLLLFVPFVNLAAFFLVNAYLLSREYFELAAARFRPLAEAAAMRRAHRPTVLAAGGVMALLMMVPILNLVTPIFGIALMVHVHKRLARRLAAPATVPSLGPGRAG